MYNNFFSDLYLGNYKPNESNDNLEEAKLLENKADEIHKKLTHSLDTDNLHLFLQFDEARDDLMDFYEIRAFAKGIRFMLDLIGNVSTTNRDSSYNLINTNVLKFIQDLYNNSNS